ncbi:hypothetical protein F2P81_009042 [Scophthalmus maximus]|uniref:Neurobeachin-like n=1 Tax=Scophthalmus maximus TaxID=52904 RepID=A0A6A4T2J4_SCOMX|nr:hypothetical protein F2P81_009042 [Scophthalmus maximus]
MSSEKPAPAPPAPAAPPPAPPGSAAALTDADRGAHPPPGSSAQQQQQQQVAAGASSGAAGERMVSAAGSMVLPAGVINPAVPIRNIQMKFAVLVGLIQVGEVSNRDIVETVLNLRRPALCLAYNDIDMLIFTSHISQKPVFTTKQMT